MASKALEDPTLQTNPRNVCLDDGVHVFEMSSKSFDGQILSFRINQVKDVLEW